MLFSNNTYIRLIAIIINSSTIVWLALAFQVKTAPAASQNAIMKLSSIERIGESNSNDRDLNPIPTVTTSSRIVPAESDSINDKTYQTLYNIERIFCLSDLHTDSDINLKYLEENIVLMKTKTTTAANGSDYQRRLNSNDLIIVAGDISHDIQRLAETIQLLKTYNSHIVFVPGNHEAWVGGPVGATSSNNNQNDDDDEIIHRMDSIQKLQLVQDTCREYGCHVDPIYVHDRFNPVWIVPLQSWYDGTLSFNDELCTGFETWPWVDFYKCVWPFPIQPKTSPDARIPIGVTEYYHQTNTQAIEHIRSDILLKQQQQQSSDASNNRNQDDNLYSTKTIGLITVSHFLPNQQCLPDWRVLDADLFDSQTWLDHGAGEVSAKFAKVSGSKLLDEQIRTIVSTSSSDEMKKTAPSPIKVRQIHIFGHSHRPKDFEYKGIRYIHHPLGKPKERLYHMISPNVQFKLIWTFQNNNVSTINTPPAITHQERIAGEVPSRTIIRFWEDYENGIRDDDYEEKDGEDSSPKINTSSKDALPEKQRMVHLHKDRLNDPTTR